MTTEQTLRVIDWDTHFESGKSRTYENKSQCYHPAKFGVGYMHLITRPNGVALYGAWSALVVVLSQQSKPRQGWITSDGTPTGRPLTPEDLELRTRVKKEYFTELFAEALSVNIGWLEASEATPTVVRPHSDRGATVVPSPSPSPTPPKPIVSHPDSRRLATLFFNLLTDKNNGKKPVTTIKVCTRDMEKLLKDVEAEEIETAIRWVFKENIERGQYALIIESVRALREKFDKVRENMNKPPEPKPRSLRDQMLYGNPGARIKICGEPGA